MTKWQADRKIKRLLKFHYWAYVNTPMLSASMLHYFFDLQDFRILTLRTCFYKYIIKKVATISYRFQVYPQAPRKYKSKITAAIVSYSFVIYPKFVHVIFFYLTEFWLQKKKLHISGLFLLPCCYNQPFSDKYLFSRTLYLFLSS
jgi:uncharacterized protein with PQ loop repeat